MKINHFIINTFRKIGQSLVKGNTEPQIKYKRDRYGNLYWQVYDVTTNQSYAFGSEQDVRAWIEERHHSF